MTKHLRAKIYSWMRLSWMFASATLVTIKQLINPSPALDTSASAASFSVTGGADAMGRISLAQRLIIRSS